MMKRICQRQYWYFMWYHDIKFGKWSLQIGSTKPATILVIFPLLGYSHLSIHSLSRSHIHFYEYILDQVYAHEIFHTFTNWHIETQSYTQFTIHAKAIIHSFIRSFFQFIFNYVFILFFRLLLLSWQSIELIYILVFIGFVKLK